MKLAMEMACKFLLEALANEPVQSNELFEEGGRRGISRATLKRAKKELNLRARKTRQVMHGTWTWELPGGQRRPARAKGALREKVSTFEDAH